MDAKICDSCGKQYYGNHYFFSVWMPPEFLDRESTATIKESIGKHHVHLDGKIHGSFGFSHAGMSETQTYNLDLCSSCYKMVFDEALKEVTKQAEKFNE